QIRSHWVINAYLLVLAALAAGAGKLGDVLGLRTLFSIGLLVFGLSSLIAGFADSGAWLITARAFQGVGAAIVFPGSMAMITIVFPAEQRGMALGIYGAIGTVFLTAGPFVGGLFTELLSWRWIFWVNLPLVAAVATIVLLAWDDPKHDASGAPFDYRGLAGLAGGLFMLVFAIMEGPDWGWTHPLISIAFVGGCLVLGWFAVAEYRSRAPLIEVDLFRNASFTVSNLVVLTAQFTKMAVIVMGALYLQTVLDMNPLVAGIALLVAVAPEPFTGAPTGRLTDRYGARRPVLVGLLATFIGLLWLGLFAGWENYWLLVPGLVLWGIVQPAMFVPAMRGVMNAVPVAKQGQASGIVLTAQLLGGTLGMAILGTVLATTQSYRLVFLATTALVGLVLLLAWFAVEGDASKDHA
ncbi:MAG: MFS transporter, partial [Pseudomonadota bacterium]